MWHSSRNMTNVRGTLTSSCSIWASTIYDIYMNFLPVGSGHSGLIPSGAREAKLLDHWGRILYKVDKGGSTRQYHNINGFQFLLEENKPLLPWCIRRMQCFPSRSTRLRGVVLNSTKKWTMHGLSALLTWSIKQDTSHTFGSSPPNKERSEDTNPR